MRRDCDCLGGSNVLTKVNSNVLTKVKHCIAIMSVYEEYGIVIVRV